MTFNLRFIYHELLLFRLMHKMYILFSSLGYVSVRVKAQSLTT